MGFDFLDQMEIDFDKNDRYKFNIVLETANKLKNLKKEFKSKAQIIRSSINDKLDDINEKID